jgi:hypothetical protein
MTIPNALRRSCLPRDSLSGVIDYGLGPARWQPDVVLNLAVFKVACRSSPAADAPAQAKRRIGSLVLPQSQAARDYDERPV